MHLSEHFSLQEFTLSQVATRRGILNEPGKEEVQNIKALCVELLEPLRVALGKPVMISSGYRSWELNKAVGGSSRSQHCRGMAADIVVPDMSAKSLAHYIESSQMAFDQLIFEGSWVHVSYAPGQKRRGKVLSARFTDNGTQYQVGIV